MTDYLGECVGVCAIYEHICTRCFRRPVHQTTNEWRAFELAVACRCCSEPGSRDILHDILRVLPCDIRIAAIWHGSGGLFCVRLFETTSLKIQKTHGKIEKAAPPLKADSYAVGLVLVGH